MFCKLLLHRLGISKLNQSQTMYSPADAVLSFPPFVAVEGVINIRSIGGYKSDASLNRVVRPAIVFRSGEVSRITEAGKEQLRALGVRRVFDLRTNFEAEVYDAAAPVIPGIEVVRAPMGVEGGWDVEIIDKRLKHFRENELQAFVQDARDTLDADGPAIETVFRHFIDRPDEPCLFHCTAGKDRTGLVAALILLLLRVDDADIARDYALTTVGLDPARPMLAARLQKVPVFQNNWEGAVNMGSSKEETMMVILAMIREEYGGAAGYLTARTGLREEDLEVVRKNLTVAKEK
ncbi:protein-tyrosine phosphatase-like protein [Mycena pura]|uniref:Protein-tyrosine phosphatase-like protein n=1 Tax=Mycena pura TaxID=153505 RepID=A0AAD6V2Z5_9AGAR|nr:protein-tyrosine phosphatase-like protein [Mycena pura]